MSHALSTISDRVIRTLNPPTKASARGADASNAAHNRPDTKPNRKNLFVIPKPLLPLFQRVAH